jgi:hypothetical protein
VGPGRSRGSFVSGEVEKRARLGKKEDEGAGGPNTDLVRVEFGNVGPRGVPTRTQRLSNVFWTKEFRLRWIV